MLLESLGLFVKVGLLVEGFSGDLFSSFRLCIVVFSQLMSAALCCLPYSCLFFGVNFFLGIVAFWGVLCFIYVDL